MTKVFFKQPIVIIVFLSFAISMAYSFYFQITPLVDARAYDRIAWHIAQGLGYREELNTDFLHDNSIIRVGPGYEFFLAAIYWIFGHRIWIMWVLHALLLACSAYLAFSVSNQVFGERNTNIGVVAAALVGLSPDLITMSAMLMTEVLAVFLTLLSTYLLFRYVDSPKTSAIILFGVVGAVAILVRTPLLFLLIPVFGFLFLHKRWGHAMLLVIVVVLLFAPWTLRNYKAFGVFLPTNAASGVNMLAGNHEGASGEQEPYEVLVRYAREYDYIDANKRANSDARVFIFQHPFEYVTLTLKRISIYFSFARPTGFWFHLHGFSKLTTLLLSALYSIMLFVFGFWGAWGAWKASNENRTKIRLLLAMLIMMPLAIVGIIVETRYRFLSYPFFAIFAAYGAHALLARRLRLTPIAVISALLFANTAFDILRNLDRILERLHGL